MLQDKPEAVAYEAEEEAVYDAAGGAEGSDEAGEVGDAFEAAEAVQAAEAAATVGEGRERAAGASPSQAQSPERLEEVMNSGLHFISGLLEMATGQKLSPLADGQKLIQVDKATGEVTMKFKLPGF